MKKILITFTICCLQSFMFAQVPRFLDWKPTQTRTIQITPPYTNKSSLSAKTQRVVAGIEHFGMMLGSRYNTDDIDCFFYERYGENAFCGGCGDIHQIRVFSNCRIEEGVFGLFTIDFYKGRFWKIVYSDIKNEPLEFADKLEYKYSDYSISDTSYEYQCGDVNIEFFRNELKYTSYSVTKSILGY